MLDRPPDLRSRLKAALAHPGRATSDYDLNNVTLPEGRKLRPAAVLIAVRAESETIILTKRSAALKQHPGQVAFPGGKVDATDADNVSAALREAEEEVGLPRNRVEVLGTLPPHETVTQFSLTPVLALIEGSFDPVPEAGEVDEVFEVPLAHLADRRRYLIEGRYWQGRLRRYYTVPFGPYYIWGATARVLLSLADRLDR